MSVEERLIAGTKAGDLAGVRELLDGDNSLKVNLLRMLIDAGADVNVRTGYGWTALQIAAHNGDSDIARLLIEASADASARNEKGQTAAAIATEGGHKELALYLEGEEQKK